MLGVSRSQSPEWSNMTDSSLSENPPSWSSFTDSDQEIYSGGSESPCPVWSSDWSSCPIWSSFTNSSNDPQENWEAASLGSSPSSRPSMISDQNYIPDSTFGLHISASKPQAESDTSDHVTPTIATHLANSDLWIAAYHDLEAVKPGSVVKLTLLDFFLSWESHQSQHLGNGVNSFYYLHSETVKRLTGDPDQDKSLLKKCLGLSNQLIDCAPVIFLVNPMPNTYFLVLFDFSKKKALILGRYSLTRIDSIAYAEWQSWAGPTLWKRIGRAFNWLSAETTGGQSEAMVYEPKWIPDSHSGPGISAFAKLLRDKDWSWDMLSLDPPDLVCDHKAREEMFYTILQTSHACFTLWKKMAKGNKEWIQPPDKLIDEMHVPPAQYQWVRNLGLIFLNQRSRCKKCAASIDLEINDPQSPYLKGKDLYPPSKIRTNLATHLPNPLPLTETDPSSSSPETSDSLADFDDYSTAPVWTETAQPHFDVWTFDSSGLQVLPNFAAGWKDRGYRLPPDFSKVSQKKDPENYISRLLPTINDVTYEESKATPSVKGHPTTIPEAIPFSAKQMLDEAGNIPKTKGSYDVFIRGKTRTDDFLQLDLEQDHVSLTKDRVSISIDIDSILWITTHTSLTFKGAVNLHLLPQFADEPPFSANPSVYISLLGPPEDERELINPHLRSKARYPLSSVPHMPFGYFGEASQQFNLYIFFPRMIHKNPNNNRTITIMPLELQELWFSEAFFQALTSALDCYPGITEYIPSSTEQIRWKTGDRARRPTLALVPEALASLLATIHRIVSQNEDLLSRFGSFFFVLDARGIKLLSKQHRLGETAFETLQRIVPGLDWNYMQDRTKGELYLDLGVSFHPTNTTEPLVGLWRLEALRSSYALLGKSTKNSKEYHHNSMRDYGGIKAETSPHVMHGTHIVKRISYNLHFECIRQPGQRSYIASLDNAIQCNQKYLDGCTRWMMALEAGAKQSYGVRDELRASAFVVLEHLRVVQERAEKFLESDPIIWIPAKTFFAFAVRQFMELQDIHRTLATTRPPIYGTLTALILHLMQNIMATPSYIPSYVQSALNSLQQRAVMERFGMFFIDDLDPEDMERIIVNLGAEDGSEIGREHKHALATMLTKKAKDKRVQLISSRITTECPWGETISWLMLQRLCRQSPVDFLRPFHFQTPDIGQISPEILEITTDLFIAFTREAWLCLQESFLPAGIRPRPASLKQAMEVWACQKILVLLGGKSTFLPSSHQLEGAPKTKNSDVSFQELRSLCFPSPNKPFKPNTIWVGFTEHGGYVSRYWQVLEEKEDALDIIDAIHQSLDEIFGQLQCLPQCTMDSLWHATDGSVCFLANPIYYRVKSIDSRVRQMAIGPQRPQVSTAELRKRLNPGVTITRKRKRNYAKKGSGKSKNYRQPPKKQRKIENPSCPRPSHVTRNSLRRGNFDWSSSESEDGSSSSKSDVDRMDTDSSMD